MRRRLSPQNRYPSPCRFRFALPLAVLSLVIASSANAVPERAQPPSPSQPEEPAQNAAPPNASLPTPPAEPPPASEFGKLPAPSDDTGVRIDAEGGILVEQETGHLRAQKNVVARYADVTITADVLEGNPERELVFRGNPRLERAGIVTRADAIHLYPRDLTFRLDNPRGIVQPDLLRGQVTEPVAIQGGMLFGAKSGYGLGEKLTITTCVEERPHYALRARSAELIPNKRLTLRHAGIVLFGKQIIVLPTIIIPLDRRYRRLRADYLPELGRNLNEGYFARFPYAFAIGAAAASLLRLDLTEKLGPGYRIEQGYLAGKQESFYDTSSAYPQDPQFNLSPLIGGDGAITSAYGYGPTRGRRPQLGTGLGPQNGGLFAMQGYFKDGFDNNFNASFRHQQGIGGSNRFGLQAEYQKNSFLTFTNQTSLNTRFNFNHSDPTHGVNADLNLGYQRNDSGNFNTNQITGSYRQSFDFDSRGSTRNNFAYSLDLNRISNQSDTLFTRTARLDLRLNFRHDAREYSYSVDYNKNTPVGTQTGAGAFGTLESLPELKMNVITNQFKGGWLSRLRSRFDIGYGRFSEPGSGTLDDRIALGFTLDETTLVQGRSTELRVGGGFEQRLYGVGAAQFVTRNTSRLRQRLGGRSGFDLNYQYQEPAGGTPFFFDTFGKTHNINLDAGYLDDSRFQMTARVGYDFLGTSRERPWQSLSARMMWRPSSQARFDLLGTYDPNTGRFFQVSGSMRLRGRDDFALDLITRYDPNLGKFSQINTQFNVPFLRAWRLAGLLRYNGLRKRMESANLQLVYNWDCLEASFTYTSSPLGFRNDQEFFFMLRITALPFFRSFARGPAGESVGPGLGDFY